MKMQLVLGVLCAVGVSACDKDSTSQRSSAPPGETRNPTAAQPMPNNTGINTRDRVADAKTAGAQGQGKNDVEVTANIRKRVMATELSMNAKNCKIVTQDGKVTLRGPVKDQSEKDDIGRIAVDVAGVDKVDNQLDIQTNPG